VCSSYSPTACPSCLRTRPDVGLLSAFPSPPFCSAHTHPLLFSTCYYLPCLTSRLLFPFSSLLLLAYISRSSISLASHFLMTYVLLMPAVNTCRARDYVHGCILQAYPVTDKSGDSSFCFVSSLRRHRPSRRCQI